MKAGAGIRALKSAAGLDKGELRAEAFIFYPDTADKCGRERDF